MEIYRELEDAIREETENIPETTEFKQRFSKLMENYMDRMGSEAEIAEVIDLITLTGDAYED